MRASSQFLPSNFILISIFYLFIFFSYPRQRDHEHSAKCKIGRSWQEQVAVGCNVLNCRTSKVLHRYYKCVTCTKITLVGPNGPQNSGKSIRMSFSHFILYIESELYTQ